MLKNLMVLSAFVMLGGCETLNQESQCDPDKNYVISNPEAMEEYKILKNSEETADFSYEKKSASKCSSDNKYCESITKQENSNISRYKLTFDETMQDQKIIKFEDIRTSRVLYEVSYQTYSKKAMGGPGIGLCKSTNNNSNIKFDALSFPYNPVIKNQYE